MIRELPFATARQPLTALTLHWESKAVKLVPLLIPLLPVESNLAIDSNTDGIFSSGESVMYTNQYSPREVPDDILLTWLLLISL